MKCFKDEKNKFQLMDEDEAIKKHIELTKNTHEFTECDRLICEHFFVRNNIKEINRQLKDKSYIETEL